MPRPGGGVDRCGAVGGDPPHALRAGPLDQRDSPAHRQGPKDDPTGDQEPSQPPDYSRPPGGSKLAAHREQITQLLRDEEGITNTRIRELITEAGYRGAKTILDDYLRELRPILCPKRTYQRTVYRPGELAQLSRRRRRPRLLKALRGPRLRHELLPLIARRPARDDRLGPRGSGPRRSRQRERGPRRLLRSFGARLADPSRTRAPWSALTASCARALSRRGALRAPSTSRTNSTAGSESVPTPAFTAASAPFPAQRLLEEAERMRSLPSPMPDALIPG